MRFERDDAKVGLLILVALAAFSTLAFQHAIRALFHREVRHVVLLDNVTDLSVGTEVQLQGHRVGQTEAIEMRREGASYRFEVVLALRPDLVLWKGTRAILESKVVGGSFLELRLPPPGERRTELKSGEPIEGETAATLGTLLGDLTDLARGLGQALGELTGELKSRGLASLLEHPEVRGTFAEARTALGALQKASRTADATLAHGDETLVALDRSVASLERSLGIVQKLAERREGDVDALLLEMGQASQQLKSAGVEMNGLLKSAGPEATESLRALRRTLVSAEELLEILKAKPSRVVFGTPSPEERERARRSVGESRKPTQGSPPAP